MKNRRMILWLVIALVLTMGAHILLSYKGGVGTALVSRTSLLDAGFSTASRIVVSRPGNPDSVIVKDGRWRLVEPYSAVADERTILKLLDSLTSGEIDETIGDSELLKLGRTHEDFGLSEDDSLKITVDSTDSSVTILFGLATPTGDGVYATVEGEDAVYAVSSNILASVDLPSEGFRQRAVFPAWAGAVVAFDVKYGPGSFMRFVRDGDAWSMREPASSGANAAKIRKLLGDITSAEAVDFVWPVGAKGEGAIATVSLLASYGLDPESAVTLTLKCADGLDRQISFGKAAKNGLVYALIQNAGAIVTVSGSLRDQALAGVGGFTDTRIFPFDQSTSSRISVTDGEANYLLAKGDDGVWRLDAPVAAPTDMDSVNTLLDKVFSLKSTDLDEDSGILVSVSTSSPPVSVSRDAMLGEIRLEDLRSKEIMKIESSLVKRIVVSTPGTKPTAVVYDKDRQAWNVEQSAIPGSTDAEAIGGILAALDPLVAKRIARLKVSTSDLKKYGLDAPRMTIAIDQDRDDAVRRNLLIGRDAVGGAFATLGATDAVFVLPEDAVRRFSAPLVTGR